MTPLSTLDLLILAIFALSTVVGAVRGFLREALALVIWVSAFIIASLFADPLATALGESIAADRLRFPLAFGFLFLATLIAGTLVSHTLGMLVEATGLSGLDRVLGTVFGAGRALVLVVVAGALTADLFRETAWWQASALLPPLLAAQDAVFEFFAALLDAILAVGEGA